LLKRFLHSKGHLKKVFSPDIGVEPSSQVLDILAYAGGLILGLVLFSTKNPNFEISFSKVGITAAGPLPIFTGFPIKPFFGT
jgi:hypothetical protein